MGKMKLYFDGIIGMAEDYSRSYLFRYRGKIDIRELTGANSWGWLPMALEIFC